MTSQELDAAIMSGLAQLSESDKDFVPRFVALLVFNLEFAAAHKAAIRAGQGCPDIETAWAPVAVWEQKPLATDGRKG